MAKISGPLLDRIDLHIEVPAVPYQELSSARDGTTSQRMRDQVIRARDVQTKRFQGSRIRTNAQMTTRQIREHCKLDGPSLKMLEASVHELGLSARAHDKVLRVARTIADMEGSAAIAAEHVSEAVNYRMLDRKLWS